jgi:hypothetical protein
MNDTRADDNIHSMNNSITHVHLLVHDVGTTNDSRHDTYYVGVHTNTSSSYEHNESNSLGHSQSFVTPARLRSIRPVCSNHSETEDIIEPTMHMTARTSSAVTTSTIDPTTIHSSNEDHDGNVIYSPSNSLVELPPGSMQGYVRNLQRPDAPDSTIALPFLLGPNQAHSSGNFMRTMAVY